MAGDKKSKGQGSGEAIEGVVVHPGRTGRPSEYDPEICDRICELISDGNSLRKVCREDATMPARTTIFKWLRDYEDFAHQYARAKEASAEALADDIEEIAHQTLSGKLDPHAARVAGDLLKWSASKLKPKKYGDKLDLTTDGKALPTPLFSGRSTVKPIPKPAKQPVQQG